MKKISDLLLMLQRKKQSLILLLLLLAIPIILYVSSQEQTIQQDASGKPLAIRIVGNHLVDAEGQTIRLIGVNRFGHCSTGVAMHGTMDQASVDLLKHWHINSVRIIMNEDCWLGIHGMPGGGLSASSLQNQIVSYIKLLNENGLYVIFDLHTSGPNWGNRPSNGQQVMADEDNAIKYWTSVANTFKNDPAVILEPYNEPHITTTDAVTSDPWACWRDGCEVREYNYSYNGPKVQHDWLGAGMQQLVNTIRSTGATNVITLGGLGYSNNLSGILKSDSNHKPYLPTDPLHQLAITFHNYKGWACGPGSSTTPDCWDSTVAPVAQQMPIITDEMGQDDCGYDYVGKYMNWADAHGVSYLGWTWVPGKCDAGVTGADAGQWGWLDADWTTPNRYGLPILQHYVAIALTLTPTPTLTLTPTISVSPSPSLSTSPSPGKNYVAFSLTLCPHGLGNCGDNSNSLLGGGNTAPKHPTRTVSVTFLNKTNTPVKTIQAVVSYNSSTQNFQGTQPQVTLPNGDYLVKINMDDYLTKQLPGVISVKQGQKINLPEVFLVTGDVNNDNKLDILDWNIITTLCFTTNATSQVCPYPITDQSSGADLNDDGIIDIADANLFFREIAVQQGAGGDIGKPTLSSQTPAVGTSSTSLHTNNQWLITHLILNKLILQDPLTTKWFFDTQDAFVLKGAMTNYKATPIADYTSYAQFSQDLAYGNFPKGVSWVMYGIESTTNSPVEEKQHPAFYLKKFATLAHTHKLKVMEVPGRDLVYVKGADCVKANGEDIDQAYLRCQIPVATQYADIFQVEAQGDQKDVSTYSNLVRAAETQIHTVAPNITIMSGLTTDRGDSASQIFSCWQATHTLVSGYWMNSTIPTISVAEQALDEIRAAGG